MYRIVLTHEVMAGRLNDIVAWFKQADAERKQQNPAYKPYRRFITCFGSMNQVIIEGEVKDPAQATEIWEWFAARGTGSPGSGSPSGFDAMIVPGRTELRLLKELDLGS